MTACICRPGDPEGWYREDCPTHGRADECGTCNGSGIAPDQTPQPDDEQPCPECVHQHIDGSGEGYCSCGAERCSLPGCDGHCVHPGGWIGREELLALRRPSAEAYMRLLAPPPAHAGPRPPVPCSPTGYHLPGCGCRNACQSCGHSRMHHDPDDGCGACAMAMRPFDHDYRKWTP